MPQQIVPTIMSHSDLVHILVQIWLCLQPSCHIGTLGPVSAMAAWDLGISQVFGQLIQVHFSRLSVVQFCACPIAVFLSRKFLPSLRQIVGPIPPVECLVRNPLTGRSNGLSSGTFHCEKRGEQQ